MGSLPAFLGITPVPCSRLPDGLQRIGVSENIATKARLSGGWIDKVNTRQLSDELLRYGNTASPKAPMSC
jgi:hypothetical protein